MTVAAPRVALLGFGEAAQAFVEGWGRARSGRLHAYDRKTDDPATRDAKLADYDRCGVTGEDSATAALAGAEIVLSLVTADQALIAARTAAETIEAGALYLDLNSVAPDTKRAAASLIEAAGACYVDVAVMAPVRPALLSVPLLVAGPHGDEGLQALTRLGFSPRRVEGDIGAASAIKMIRSIMVKGLEALTAECILSAYVAGVADEVIGSLDASYPGLEWSRRADYNLDRMLVHGQRRAAEMLEAAATAGALGLGGEMAGATVLWQRRIGDLALAPPDGLRAKVELILSAFRDRLA